MYYEEKLINGVMHYRTTPDGEWTAYTLYDLSARYNDTRSPSQAPLAVEVKDVLEQVAENKTLEWIKQNNIVFNTPITKPLKDSTEAERWEKIAFAIYNDLVEKVIIAKQALSDGGNSNVKLGDDYNDEMNTGFRNNSTVGWKEHFVDPLRTGADNVKIGDGGNEEGWG